jgi:hypothetical protein
MIARVTSPPFFKSHRAHNVVIGHGVKTVKSVFNLLFWSYTGLEAFCGPSERESLVVLNVLLFIKTPRFIHQHINILRFDKLIFFFKFIEVENLHLKIVFTLLESLNQSLSWHFYQTASVLRIYSLR